VVSQLDCDTGACPLIFFLATSVPECRARTTVIGSTVSPVQKNGRETVPQVFPTKKGLRLLGSTKASPDLRIIRKGFAFSFHILIL
jgi:hypothetical protein